MSMPICYLDFDRTIQESAYPEIGILNEGCIEFVLELKNKGYKIVLNTYRSNLENGSLERAVNFIEKHFAVDEILSQKLNPGTFCIENQDLFVDDEAKGIPLKKSEKFLGAMIVDFNELLKELKKMEDNEIIIGTQTWSKYNTNTLIFQNGDLIPEPKTKGEWYNHIKEGKPALFKSKEFPGEVLYNYYALTDPRGILTKEWRVPNLIDIRNLFDFVGGKEVAALKLKSTNPNDFEEIVFLEEQEIARKITIGNSSRFTAKSVGARSPNGRFFSGMSANFWIIDEEMPFRLNLIDGETTAFVDNDTHFIRTFGFKIIDYAFSLRAIKKNVPSKKS